MNKRLETDRAQCCLTGQNMAWTTNKAGARLQRALSWLSPRAENSSIQHLKDNQITIFRLVHVVIHQSILSTLVCTCTLRTLHSAEFLTPWQRLAGVCAPCILPLSSNFNAQPFRSLFFPLILQARKVQVPSFDHLKKVHDARPCAVLCKPGPLLYSCNNTL